MKRPDLELKTVTVLTWNTLYIGRRSQPRRGAGCGNEKRVVKIFGRLSTLVGIFRKCYFRYV